VFAVEHPSKGRAGFFAHLFDLEVAESILMEVAKETPEDDEGFCAQRPIPPEALEDEILWRAANALCGEEAIDVF
jgi:hypothetical protein